MGRTDKQKTPAEKLDPAMWISRREAARILNVSLPTILRWEGPRFRITSTRDASGRVSWFVNAEDVERVRLQRMGPTLAETEAFVLIELAAGKTASEIVRAGRHVTLADVERIHDHDARMSGKVVLDLPASRELRELLGVEMINGSILIANIRSLMVRIEVLVGQHYGANAPASR